MWSTTLETSIADALDKEQPTKEVTQKGDACGAVVVQDFEVSPTDTTEERIVFDRDRVRFFRLKQGYS
jgi:sulfur carrier protein ThiS